MLHRTGNKYKSNDGLIGLLTTFMIGGQSYCMLTTIANSEDLNYKELNGNRYIDPIKVNDPYNLTAEEITRIAGNDWQPYNQLVSI